MCRLLGLALFASALAACGSPLTGDDPAAVDLAVPAGWPAVPVPAGNPMTEKKVALGERLFFDAGLSRTGLVACASCHLPELAFSDGLAVSRGVDGRRGLRNAPSLIGVAYERSFFRDGGALTLEGQALAPLEEPAEMDADLGAVLARLTTDSSYAEAFRDAFGGEGPTVRTLTQALASFQRTLLPTGAPVDRFLTGDTLALSPAARAGARLFAGRAQCSTCHAGVRQTDGSFRVNGLAPTDADGGRVRITSAEADLGRFKVPSLRNVARTAPYMHDGRIRTLRAVVEHYDRGGAGLPNQDPAVRPLGLSPAERDALVAFLESLTDDRLR